MGQTATLLATALLQDPQTQVGHNFIIGETVRWDGVNWVYADNTSEANAEEIGMVSGIADVDHFYLTQTGRVSNLATAPVSPGGAFVPGTRYYLSSTPGKLTATPPAAIGLVKLACYQAFTPTNGYFFTGQGDLISSAPSTFTWYTVTTDTNLAVNSGYVFNSAVDRVFTLPGSFAVGDMIEIISINTGKINIAQNNLQSIILGAGGITTVGVTGTLAGTTSYQKLTLTGVTATQMYADSASAFLGT